MDNVRLFLIMGLVFLGMLLWQSWQADYGGVTNVPQTAQTGGQVPASPTAGQGDTPAAPSSVMMSSPSAGDQPAVPGTPRRIEVRTDTLTLQIDTRGGTIARALLEQYPVSVELPDRKFELLTDGSLYYAAQSGLVSAAAERAPTHQAVYETEKNLYELGDREEMDVELVWRSPDGVQVIKRYHFTRGSHRVELSHEIVNSSESAWTGGEYRQLQRVDPSSGGNIFMPTFTGGAIYTPEDKYQKYTFEELGEGQLQRQVQGGWVSMLQHYFVAALVPPQETGNTFFGKFNQGKYIIGYQTPGISVAPGASHSFSGAMWLGPKIQDQLEAIAPGLDLTVDYGWLTFLSKPMFWILEFIHDLVGNWGWTIIIFTILIKGLFFYPSAVSYKSMAGMRKLAPRVQALKDRFGDDKERMQQAMMEIYKKEKINPLSGCLPILLQMPFFIALYYVLLESVELRQADWIWWIQDLSIKDPYFVLPILMGVSMLIQQKLNPPPPDPMQAKIMMALPIVFTGMFAFFPAGLVLYWFANNLLSIVQQWVITKQVEQAG